MAEPEPKDLRGLSGGVGKPNPCRRGRPAGVALRGEAALRCGFPLVREARSFDSHGLTFPERGSFSPRSLRMTTRFFYFARDDGKQDGRLNADV
jgi:hypothetical protein